MPAQRLEIDQAERLAIGGDGFVMTPQAAQKIGAGGRQGVVVRKRAAGRDGIQQPEAALAV